MRHDEGCANPLYGRVVCQVRPHSGHRYVMVRSLLPTMVAVGTPDAPWHDGHIASREVVAEALIV